MTKLLLHLEPLFHLRDICRIPDREGDLRREGKVGESNGKHNEFVEVTRERGRRRGLAKGLVRCLIDRCQWLVVGKQSNGDVDVVGWQGATLQGSAANCQGDECVGSASPRVLNNLLRLTFAASTEAEHRTAWQSCRNPCPSSAAADTKKDWIVEGQKCRTRYHPLVSISFGTCAHHIRRRPRLWRLSRGPSAKRRGNICTVRMYC